MYDSGEAPSSLAGNVILHYNVVLENGEFDKSEFVWCDLKFCHRKLQKTPAKWNKVELFQEQYVKQLYTLPFLYAFLTYDYLTIPGAVLYEYKLCVSWALHIHAIYSKCPGSLHLISFSWPYSLDDLTAIKETQFDVMHIWACTTSLVIHVQYII